MADGSRVVLFRESRVDDPYAGHLRAAGFEPEHRQVLSFQPTNEPALRDVLSRPDDFSGLVITSERGARRLIDAGASDAWMRKPVFAVGPRTRLVLEEHGYSPPGPVARSGAELARVIRSEHRDARPLLFPCSSRRRDDLPDALRAAGVSLVELAVYDTTAEMSPGIGHSAAPDWVVFFSPSGVEAVAEFVASRWTNARRAAIGPTTASALDAAGIPAHAVAASPDPEALVTALQRG